MSRRPALALLLAATTLGVASPAAARDESDDAHVLPAPANDAPLTPSERLRSPDHWALVDDAATVGLSVAAFRLENYGYLQNDVLYGDVHPSCALIGCDGSAPSHAMPTWDDVKLATTSLAFAALGVGATWLVTPGSQRLGVQSLEIKLTTGGTTGLTLIGRF